jgi:hypothetical protein
MGPLCKEGKFARRIACFANWDFGANPLTTETYVVHLAKFARFVCRRGSVVLSEKSRKRPIEFLRFEICLGFEI